MDVTIKQIKAMVIMLPTANIDNHNKLSIYYDYGHGIVILELHVIVVVYSA
jgi:hypothetical protein